MTAEIADLPPEGMELMGVALAGHSDGAPATWGLTLVFTAAGITIQHPQSQDESLLAWSGLDATRCAERIVLPDGRDVSVLELISNGRSLRFFLPTDSVALGQAAYLEQALPRWLARYKSASVVVPASVPPVPTPPAAMITDVPLGTAATGPVATGPVVTGHLSEDRTSSEPDLRQPGSAAPVGPAPGDLFGSNGQAPESAAADGGVDPVSGDPFSAGEATEQPSGQRKRTRVLLIVPLVAAVIAAAVYWATKHDDSARPSASTAASALAASINVQASDLPAGWGVTTAAGSAPPAAPPNVREKAAQTLASCIRQPVGVVEGWFGTAPFPRQIASVRSDTFQSGSAPTVQIFSTTAVMRSLAQRRSLLAPFRAPNFATCLGQYQAAAVAVPITAQVQVVELSAPAGVAVYGYATIFTLSNQQAEVVDDVFVVGGRTATVLQPSTTGLLVPSADFTTAYHAVVRRVAQADR